MPGPLSHVTVVDLSQVVSGPLCGMFLADQGANVIKVQEEKEGTVELLVPWTVVGRRWTVVGRLADGCRTAVGSTRVLIGAEKKSFDRGGPAWPPRSNAKYDRFGGHLGELCPPS